MCASAFFILWLACCPLGPTKLPLKPELHLGVWVFIHNGFGFNKLLKYVVC